METCSNGHPLIPIARRCQCVVCHQYRKAEIHFCCRICNSDVCSMCLPAPTAAQALFKQYTEMLDVLIKQEQLIAQWTESNHADLSVYLSLLEKDLLQQALITFYAPNDFLATSDTAAQPAIRNKIEELSKKQSVKSPLKQSRTRVDNEFEAEIRKGKIPMVAPSSIRACLLGHPLTASSAYADKCHKCFGMTGEQIGSTWHFACSICDYHVCKTCNSTPPPTEADAFLAAYKKVAKVLSFAIGVMKQFLGGDTELYDVVIAEIQGFREVTNRFDRLRMDPARYPEVKAAHEALMQQVAEFSKLSTEVASKKPAPPAAQAKPPPATAIAASFKKAAPAASPKASAQPAATPATTAVPVGTAPAAAGATVGPPGKNKSIFVPSIKNKVPPPDKMPNSKFVPTGVILQITGVNPVPSNPSIRIRIGTYIVEKEIPAVLGKRDSRFVFGLDGGDEDLTDPPLELEILSKGKPVAGARVPQKQIVSQVPLKPTPLSIPLHPSGSAALLLTSVGNGASSFAPPCEPIPTSAVRALLVEAVGSQYPASDFVRRDIHVQAVLPVDVISTQYVTFGENRRNMAEAVPLKRNPYQATPAPAADPWEIALPPGEPYTKLSRPVGQSQTERADVCGCGNGMKTCYTCGGQRSVNCNNCGGERDRKRCEYCRLDMGRVRCDDCIGSGEEVCGICRGGVRVLRYTATVIDYVAPVTGQAKIFSACEDLSNEPDYIRFDLLNEYAGTVLWEDEGPISEKPLIVPKLFEAEAATAFQKSHKLQIQLRHQMKVQLVHVPVTQICYFHPGDRIQRYFWAVGKSLDTLPTLQLACCPSITPGPRNPGIYTLEKYKLSRIQEEAEHFANGVPHGSRVTIAGDIYMMSEGLFTQSPKFYHFTLALGRLTWSEQNLVKGEVLLYGLKPNDVVLSASSKKFSSQVEGWAMEIPLKPKPVTLIFVKPKMAQRWLREIQKLLSNR